MQTRNSGFTLVELLIVVLIIGILASIAIPVFNGQRNKAKETASKSAVRQAVTVTASYKVGRNDTIVGSPIDNNPTAGTAALVAEESSFSTTPAAITDAPGANADPRKMYYSAFSSVTAASRVERGEIVFACSTSKGKYSYCAMINSGDVRLPACGAAQCDIKDGVYYARAEGPIVDAINASVAQALTGVSVPNNY